MQLKDDADEWKWYGGNITTLERGKDGKPLRMFGTIQNVEEKKNIERVQILSQEKERMRVSRDIHDSIGQMLVGTRMMLNQTLSKDVSLEKLQSVNRSIDEMLNEMIKESRYIINNFGVSITRSKTLKHAMEDLAEKMYRVYPGTIQIDWKGVEIIEDLQHASNIFRIYQEALTNAIKYAEAQNINVFVFNKNGFQMQIIDDGLGFDQSEIGEGFGLENMKIRAEQINGLLSVESVPGEGTQVVFELGLGD